MELFNIGKVVKLHGYLGQMKVSVGFDKDFDEKKITAIFDENQKEYKITKIFKNVDGFVVMLDTIGLDQAKTFVGKSLFIDRELVKDKMMIEDLKNSAVVLDTGKEIGKITNIEDFGTAEVFYVLLKNGKELLFPNVKGLICDFDYKNKKLTVSEKRLKEVSEYEN